MSDIEVGQKKIKVLIRSSQDNTENLLSFPLIHAIHEYFKEFDLELDILLDEGMFSVFELLPFEVNVFVVPTRKQSLAGIHHYSYNLNDVFNIDYFFDLRGDFKGSLFGLTFRAKEKIGFASGLNKFLLTKPVELKGRVTSDDDFLKLYNQISEITFDKKVAGVEIKREQVKLRLVSDEIEDGEVLSDEEIAVPIEKKNTFVLVVINKLFHDEHKNKLWFDFFDCYIDERFAIYFNDVECAVDDGEQCPVIKSFFEKLDKRNKYIHVPEIDVKNLKTIALEASCIFTDVKWIGPMSSYLGKKSYTFYPENEVLYHLEHFEVYPEIVLTRGTMPVKLLGATENIRLDDMAELIDVSQGIARK